MRIAVFGGSGATGGHVIGLALEQGHEVVALTRDARAFPHHGPRLEVVEGSATDAADVARVLAGADAVVHCLGVGGVGGRGDGQPTSVVSDSVRAVLAEMTRSGVRRIICMSNVGAGGSDTWFARRVVVPLFLRWLRPILADKDAMEAELRASSVEWVAVRLPSIGAGPAGPVRVSADGRRVGRSVTAASAARFLLAQVTDDRWVRRTPSISD